MKLSISSDFPELAAHLNALYFKLDGDLSEPMGAVAALLENSTRKRFETKTAPDGSQWEGLSAATKKAKQAKGTFGRGILIDDGLMRRITSYATEQMATVGTAYQYAQYHQEGTSKMPQRAIFGLSDQDRIDIRDTLTDWLQELWSES